MINENILNNEDIAYIENDYSTSNNKDDYEI